MIVVRNVATKATPAGYIERGISKSYAGPRCENSPALLAILSMWASKIYPPPAHRVDSIFYARLIANAIRRVGSSVRSNDAPRFKMRITIGLWPENLETLCLSVAPKSCH